MRLIPLAGLLGLVLSAPLQALQHSSQAEVVHVCGWSTPPALIVVAVPATCTPEVLTNLPLTEERIPSPSFETVTSVINPFQDTFVGENSPHDNNGNQNRIRIKGKNGTNRIHRSLIQFNQQTILDFVGSGTLQSATLEFTVEDASGWGSSGRYVGVHRMTQEWTELGATWACADDSNTSNATLDCTSANTWDMEANPGALLYLDAATDSTLVQNTSGGETISVDVTADVAAFLSGSGLNFGWILRKVDDDANGDIDVTSRTGANPPRLTLTRESSSQVPATPPDSVPSSIYAEENFVSNSTIMAGTFLRTALWVEFDTTATQAERQTAIDAIEGEVIGGRVYTGGGEGVYLVAIPDDGTDGPLFAAIATLEALQTVQSAYPEVILNDPLG